MEIIIIAAYVGAVASLIWAIRNRRSKDGAPRTRERDDDWLERREQRRERIHESRSTGSGRSSGGGGRSSGGGAGRGRH